jgi:hypothetical protein
MVIGNAMTTCGLVLSRAPGQDAGNQYQQK